MRTWVLLLVLSGAAWGQAAKIDYECTPDDIDQFGLTCDEDEPCPVYLEMVQAEGVGSTIFVSGNLHTQTTTMWGLLLASEDGGATWTEPAHRFPSAQIEHIAFADLQHGWVSGVMIDPLPRDAFFLITSDGGKSWRRLPMFEDTHYGSVTQFWFTSATEGGAMVDASQGSSKKYETYATRTGGTSWDPKEITQTPPKAVATKSVGSWRVRVDSTAKAYRVEKRVAAGEDHWETVASFPVAVGVCK